MATTVNYYDVPLKRLNYQNALGLGVVFTDFENAKIELCSGISIHPGVWHTNPISLSGKEVVYHRKQGSIYATIDCFLTKEHNTWLKIPLGQPQDG
ncbi:hypothetical protein [Moorena sp. SIO3H5]|uniref:hypothetical protein n=1 Tax=Moorena sp. SIO3H5 TaxID=2607834 RepID=UPI0013B95A59|nr:hypothetical protein [Moorena sp. SIO3H5]NEO68141.1 hypothetical protein [Moorena sp. SIO3H5]